MAGKRDGPGVPKPTNKVHFACFTCRKAFKQQGSSNWDRNVPERPFPCPNCKWPMVRLGRYFKAPPQRAGRQWLKVELLYRFGERFEFFYPNEGGRVSFQCRSLASAVGYLMGLGYPKSEVQECLESIRASHQRNSGRAEPSAAPDRPRD